jgi:hypothetical protein
VNHQLPVSKVFHTVRRIDYRCTDDVLQVSANYVGISSNPDLLLSSEREKPLKEKEAEKVKKKTSTLMSL